MQRRTVIMPQIECEFLRNGDFAECENDFGSHVAGDDVNKQPRKSVFYRLGSITKPRSTDGGLQRDGPTVCTRKDRIRGFRKSGPVHKKMKKMRLITVRMAETMPEEPQHPTCDNTSTGIFQGTSESRIEFDTLHEFKLNLDRPKLDDDRDAAGSKCLVKLNCDGSKEDDKFKIERSNFENELNIACSIFVDKPCRPTDGSTVDDELNIDVSKIDNELNTDVSKIDDELNIHVSKIDDELNIHVSKIDDELNIAGSKFDDELHIDGSKFDELNLDESKFDGLNFGGSETSADDECLKCSLALYTGSDPDTLLIQCIDAFLEDRISLDTTIDECVLERKFPPIDSCDDDTVCGCSGSGSQTETYIDDKASTSAVNKDKFNLDIGTNLVGCPLSQYKGSDPDTYLLNMLDAFLEQDVDKPNCNESPQKTDLNCCEPKLSCRFPPQKRSASVLSDDAEDFVPAIKRHNVSPGEACLYPPRKRKISPDRNEITPPEKYARFS